MTRLLMRTLAVLSAVAMLYIFAGCSKDEEKATTAPTTDYSAALVGTWKLDSLGNGFMNLKADSSTMLMTAILNSNKTYQTFALIGFLGFPMLDTAEGTWSATASQLILSETGEDPDTMSYTLSGTRLFTSQTDTSGTETMIFRKQ